MAIFYDWRDRTGKGWKPWPEQLKDLRSPWYIGIGILLLFSIALLVAVYFGYWRPDSATKSERVYLLPDPSGQKASILEAGSVSMPFLPSKLVWLWLKRLG